MKIKIAVIASLALFAGAACAEDTGFYVGAGVGWSQISIPKAKITNGIAAEVESLGAPIDTWSAKADESSIPWNLTVGYRFYKYLAVEAGYLEAGTATYTGKGTVDDIDLGILPAKGTLDWQAHGAQVSVLGIWPIDPTWSVFGRVGGFFGDVKASAKASVTVGETVFTGKAHENTNSNEFLYGVGVDSHFLDRWTARVEWMAMPSLGNNDTGSADWNGVLLSFLYQF